MIRIALIALFGFAVFMTAFAVMNPDTFFREKEETSAKTTKRTGTSSTTGTNSMDCPNCPLPSN